jgi:hypothetical protein
MTIERAHYEELLATYSQASSAIELLKQHRPYLELMPSMRRPQESLITIPLPIVKLRRIEHLAHAQIKTFESMLLPCEVSILMCDPEWKIKTGHEIFIFVYRPEEDFSDLLGRWRKTQLILSQDYEWLLPPKYQHFLSEGTEKIYPLFVLFEETPERVRKGLKGANLPFVMQNLFQTTTDPSHGFSQAGSVAESSVESSIVEDASLGD